MVGSCGARHASQIASGSGGRGPGRWGRAYIGSLGERAEVECLRGEPESGRLPGRAGSTRAGRIINPTGGGWKSGGGRAARRVLCGCQGGRSSCGGGRRYGAYWNEAASGGAWGGGCIEAYN